MTKRWYNYFLSVDQPEEGKAEEAASAEESRAPRTAAQTVAEIASGVTAEPKFTGPVTHPASFQEIYEAAEITAPSHGFTVLKIIDLIQSEHIRNLSREVKRSSLLLALEAAGVISQWRPGSGRTGTAGTSILSIAGRRRRIAVSKYGRELSVGRA